MTEAGTVFLMYHELALPGRSLCHREPGYARYVVSASDFRNQMERLASQGWRGKNVSQALQSFDPNSVCLTFDDGCETDALVAAPMLQALRFNATFFITAGFIGKAGYLSEAQLRSLYAQGFEIGCHSLTHPYLTDLDSSGLEQETAGAKSQLEQIIVGPVAHFSCPGGRWNPRVAEAVKAAQFRSMATSRTAVNFSNTDPFALARIAVLSTTSVEKFTRTCQGHGLVWTQFKEKTRDRAKHVLGNSIYDSLRSLILSGQRQTKPPRE